jgi:stearoyl-CoA desaturase (Delta-9 desaturase)
LTVVFYQSTFCINSIAHWLGTATYDDVLSPRDHLLSALLTMGEGYHNFHHQFPMDYRNAFRWYQYDPTKWFIAACGSLGLAKHLKVFPSNEIEKGALAMKLKELKQAQDMLRWPSGASDLPVVSWDTCKLLLFVLLPLSSSNSSPRRVETPNINSSRRFHP